MFLQRLLQAARFNTSSNRVRDLPACCTRAADPDLNSRARLANTFCLAKLRRVHRGPGLPLADTSNEERAKARLEQVNPSSRTWSASHWLLSPDVADISATLHSRICVDRALRRPNQGKIRALAHVEASRPAVIPFRCRQSTRRNPARSSAGSSFPREAGRPATSAQRTSTPAEYGPSNHL